MSEQLGAQAIRRATAGKRASSILYFGKSLKSRRPSRGLPPMNHDQFEALVLRLEAEHARDPARYRRRVIALAFAGFGYILAVLVLGLLMVAAALLLAIKAAWVGIKLALVVSAFVWIIFRAMWVRLAPPQGRAVTRGEAPELFALLDHLQRELHARGRFHRVLITDELNAAVVQTPRLGVFGWHRNTLIIGLPLMKALTREQLAAVLAHEIGHLGGGHARLGNWIYRLRLGWARLAAMLEESQSLGAIVFRPFHARFVPYFTAISFPLARGNEYEADANSARLTSPAAAAAALSTTAVLAGYLNERFWPVFYRQVNEHARPQFAPLEQMGSALQAPPDPDDTRRWLDEALARTTSVDDTHPSLADRLSALGEDARMALPAPGESADLLLGPALQVITEELDARWRERIAEAWDARHREVQQLRERLAGFEEAGSAGLAALPLEDRISRARLIEEVGAGEAAALAELQALLADHAEHAELNYAVGSRLLKAGDDAGVPLVERAMAQDEDAIASGAALLRDHYERRRDDEKRRFWSARHVERMELLQAAEAEREAVSARDRFVSHQLEPAALEHLRAQLAQLGLRGVWLVRKDVEHLPHRRHFVVAFVLTPWWRWRSQGRISRAQQALLDRLDLPGTATVFCGEGGNSVVWRALKKVRNSRVL